MKVDLQLGVHHVHGREGRDGALTQSNKVLFGDDARNVLLVGDLPLRLSSLLLVSSPLFLGFDAGFSSFETLSLN